eukprot:m.435270 g.435270  ORF g.435270 m.435270 type:complete len:103 (+) comp56761_c1_seq16:164-472(+)
MAMSAGGAPYMRPSAPLTNGLVDNQLLTRPETAHSVADDTAISASSLNFCLDLIGVQITSIQSDWQQHPGDAWSAHWLRNCGSFANLAQVGMFFLQCACVLV